MTRQTQLLSTSLPHFAPLFKKYDAKNSNVSWQIIQWENIAPDKLKPEQARHIGDYFPNRTKALNASAQSVRKISPVRSSRTEKEHPGVWRWTQDDAVCYQSVIPICPQDKSESKAQGVEEKSGPINAMVRLSEEAHKTLRRLAEENAKTMQAILEEAVKQYEKHLFFKGAEEDYRLLKADPQAWAEELEERKLWENTLMDGIDRNETWNEDGTVTLLSEQERQVA